MLETAGPPVYYLPPSDVRMARCGPSRTRVCEWKGGATYWTYRRRRRSRIENVGLVVPEPLPGFESITDYLAFYAGRIDEAWVGDERASPQPGRLLRRLGDVAGSSGRSRASPARSGW